MIEDLAAKIREAVVLHPGDSLVLTLPVDNPAQMAAAAEQIRAALPDVAVLCLDDRITIHVLRHGESTDPAPTSVGAVRSPTG